MSKTVRKSTFQVQITKAETDGYDATFVMSAGSPDRVNDTIDPEAYKPNLGKKLIALWQHKDDQPMGFWDNLRVVGDNLLGDLKVSATNLGTMIRQLIADGVPLGASIGFSGSGELNKIGGIHFTELELYECSIVSVPAHPLATQLAKHFDSSQSSADDEAASGHDRSEAVIRKAKAAILSANRQLRKRT